MGPGGERRLFFYRLSRWPGRVAAVAQEIGRGDAGHELEVGVAHFEDPTPLVERIRAAARATVARVQLVEDESGRPTLEATEVVGRLVEDDNPYANPRVAIEGRLFSWDEFGELLRSTVGWSFQLRLGVDAEARVGRAPGTGAGRGARAARTHCSRARAVVDLDHYPTPREWRQRQRERRPPLTE